MKKLFLFLGVLACQSGFSQAHVESYLDFHAPVIYSTSGLPVDVPGGSIVYDVSSGVFKGLAPSGSANNWVTLSAPTGSGVVVSSGSTERVERAVINVTSASACSIVSSSGSTSWISSCSASGSLVTLAIPSGLFSSAPTCTAICDPQSNGKCMVRLSSGTSATSVVLGAIDASTGYYINEKFHLICIGPR